MDRTPNRNRNSPSLSDYESFRASLQSVMRLNALMEPTDHLHPKYDQVQAPPALATDAESSPKKRVLTKIQKLEHEKRNIVHWDSQT